MSAIIPNVSEMEAKVLSKFGNIKHIGVGDDFTPIGIGKHLEKGLRIRLID